MSPTAVALIVLAGLVHAAWKIVAKKAAGDAPFAFFTAFIMMGLWAPLGGWLGRGVVPAWGTTEWMLVAAVSPVACVLVQYAMQEAPLSHVAPAREVSMLFPALMGGHLLGEGERGSRVLGALCIASGVVALG